MINCNKLDAIMLELGHTENLRGTGYVRLGVEMYEPGISMTKEVYPAIAAAANTTPSRVERAIRHSVESAWSRCDWEVQHQFFGWSVDPEKGKPTNGEYIARLARLCRED